MKKEKSAFLKACLAESLYQFCLKKGLDEITVSELCEKAGVGRTTFYRYFSPTHFAEELFAFRLTYLWKNYEESHAEEVKKDGMKALMEFCYQEKEFILFLYHNGQLEAIMDFVDQVSAQDWPKEKESSYLRSFFVYGIFGIVYQWIKYGFDETPEEVAEHNAKILLAAASAQAEKQKKAE